MAWTGAGVRLICERLSGYGQRSGAPRRCARWVTERESFAPYLDFLIYPVLEVHEATALFGQAIEFRKSIT